MNSLPSLPNLPTDNLYKFNFLSGLTLIVTGLFIFITQYQSIWNKISLAEISIEKFKVRSSFLNEDDKSIKKNLLEIQSKFKNSDGSVDVVTHLNHLNERLLKDKNYREYYAFFLSHKAELSPYEKDFNRIGIMIEKDESALREIKLNETLIDLNLKVLNRDKDTFFVLSGITVALIIVGLCMSIVGYNKWFNLIQKPNDEKLRIELLKLKGEGTS